MTATASSGLDRTSTMSAVSTATSVPAPMAMPTSAWASAGASLTPSPVMATTSPRAWTSLTLRAFSWGRTSANTSSIPIRLPTHDATFRLSPVSIMVRMPMARSLATASTSSSRTVSARATAPAGEPSITTKTTVMPWSASARTLGSSLSWPSSLSHAGLATITFLPATIPSAPLPGIARNRSTA